MVTKYLMYFQISQIVSGKGSLYMYLYPIVIVTATNPCYLYIYQGAHAFSEIKIRPL